MLLKLPILRRSLLLTVYFTALYLSFFYTLWLPGNHIDGSDAAIKHYPSREYLYNQLVGEHKFPFYTKKAFGGFPIYADYEIGYMNPINVLSIVLFGPFLSYKLLHVLTYIISSLAMYAFLKRQGVNLLGITASLVIFLYSFFMANHQIHFNIIMTVPLLPVGLVIVDRWLEDGRLR